MRYIITANYRDRQSEYPWIVREAGRPMSTAVACKSVRAERVTFSPADEEARMGCSYAAYSDNVEIIDSEPTAPALAPEPAPEPAPEDGDKPGSQYKEGTYVMARLKVIGEVDSDGELILESSGEADMYVPAGDIVSAAEPPVAEVAPVSIPIGKKAMTTESLREEFGDSLTELKYNGGFSTKSGTRLSRVDRLFLTPDKLIYALL